MFGQGKAWRRDRWLGTSSRCHSVVARFVIRFLPPRSRRICHQALDGMLAVITADLTVFVENFIFMLPLPDDTVNEFDRDIRAWIAES
jgi:hypothetical protein